MYRVAFHIVDHQEDHNIAMFWDGYLGFDGKALSVELHGRSGMDAEHAKEHREFDVSLDLLEEIRWRDRLVGSLVELAFKNPANAEKFPGTREDHRVELSIREPDEGAAEALVNAARARLGV